MGKRQVKGPPPAALFVLFLCKMHVVEDVILAEAVIPGALAAIAELEVGVVRIRPAADGALVVVRHLLCLLRPLLGLPELHGLTGCLVLRPLAEYLTACCPDVRFAVGCGGDALCFTGGCRG